MQTINTAISKNVGRWVCWLYVLGLSITLFACGGGGQSEAEANKPQLMAMADAASVAVPDVMVMGITKVSETRVSRTEFDYVFRVTIKNNGNNTLTGVTATLTGVGQGTTIVDGSVQVGSLAPSVTVIPADTITVRHDRTFAFNTASLTWVIAGSAVAGPSESATIDAAGGTIALPNGARLDIPAGALSMPTQVTLSEIPMPANAVLPTGGALVGKVYSLSPDGQSFAQPVTLTLPIDANAFPPGLDAGDVLIHKLLGGGNFEVVGNAVPNDPEPESSGQFVDEAAKTVSVRLGGFSTYAPVIVDYRGYFGPAAVQSISGASIAIRALVNGGGLRTKRAAHFNCAPSSGTTQLNSRVGNPTGVVIHSTNSGNQSHRFNQELGWAVSNCNPYFAHYYIDRNGEIFQLVDDLSRALHAAAGNWNDRSIGIELYNNVGEPFDGRQISTLIRLVDFLVTKYSINRPQRDLMTGLVTRNPITDAIVTHAEVQPGKCDPVGTFKNSAMLQTVIAGQVPCPAPTALGQPGNVPYPALMDVVLDAVAVAARTAQHTGVINTSGGDSSGQAVPGDAGSVTFAEDMAAVSAALGVAELKTSASNNVLFVAPGATMVLPAGQTYTDVLISGDLIVSGSQQLRATGTVYLAPNARILLNQTPPNGSSLTILLRGTAHLQGLVDATGQHGAIGNQPGGQGGTLDIRTASAQILFLPTILARGGNSSSALPPLTGAGAKGGDVTVFWGGGHVFVGGGVNPNPNLRPYLRDGLSVSSLPPPSYIGFELPPPPPFNVLSGGISPVAGQRTLLRKQPSQIGFTRGILTSGGMGAFGSFGGVGGAGGKIHFAGGNSSILTFRSVDLITGADVETIRANIFLSDGVQHSYFAATGALGGKGSVVGTTGGDGGAGGAAGPITVAGFLLSPSPNTSNTLASIVGFGQPGGQVVPSTLDDILNPAFQIGTVRELSSVVGLQPPQVLYRLRIDGSGNLAGGSGGIPGGRPLPGQFPGRFGLQGAGAVISGLPH